MRVLGPDDVVPSAERCVVSVGNFDGVHCGHQRLIHEVVMRARQKHLKSALITFEPHTRQVVQPDVPLQLLTTFNEKALLIERAGIDYLLCIPFSEEFRHHPPEYFVEHILHHQLHAEEWVMGEGHGIGKDRSGEKIFLHTLLSKYHIIPFTADLLMHSETIISSTQVRVNVVQGHISEAISMLGHPYLISAVRTSGLKIGTELGFPTLNFLRPPSYKVLPPPGVYAAELEFDGCIWQGALYFGDCPTFVNRTMHFEFHAFNNDTRFPVVGKEGTLWLYAFVRNDRSFLSKEELTVQIDTDVKTIKQFFIEEKRHAIDQGT